MKQKQTSYTDDFRYQMVALHKEGKSVKQLNEEYEIAKSTLRDWIRDYNNSGSFRAKDNRSEIENKLLELEKEIKKLRTTLCYSVQMKIKLKMQQRQTYHFSCQSDRAKQPFVGFIGFLQ